MSINKIPTMHTPLVSQLTRLVGPKSYFILYVLTIYDSMYPYKHPHVLFQVTLSLKGSLQMLNWRSVDLLESQELREVERDWQRNQCSVGG